LPFRAPCLDPPIAICLFSGENRRLRTRDKVIVTKGRVESLRIKAIWGPAGFQALCNRRAGRKDPPRVCGNI